jgi:hypothetical protein
MEILGNKKIPKNPSKYCCFFCHYNTSSKKDYTKHILTPKHKKQANGKDLEMFGNTKNPENPENSNKFICECSKMFITYSGLWKHKKHCNDEESNKYENPSQPKDKELIMMLIKQNSDLLEVIKNGTHNTNSHNNISNNKTFNLQFFLNETCKDAMNIMDFVDSIQLQLSDLENVGKVGYIEGISNIISTNLKALDVTQRPVHCTDKKRETLYIKDENKWEKEDEEKKKIRKVIKRVASKNQRLLPKFKEAHPDCIKAYSLFSDQYNKIIIESMGGSGDNDTEKEEKIIKNIAKNVTLDKECY